MEEELADVTHCGLGRVSATRAKLAKLAQTRPPRNSLTSLATNVSIACQEH